MEKNTKKERIPRFSLFIRVFTLRKEGLEPSRSKAITGSLVLRVCQFRHSRCSLTTYYIISATQEDVNRSNLYFLSITTCKSLDTYQFSIILG